VISQKNKKLHPFQYAHQTQRVACVCRSAFEKILLFLETSIPHCDFVKRCDISKGTTACDTDEKDRLPICKNLTMTAAYLKYNGHLCSTSPGNKKIWLKNHQLPMVWKSFENIRGVVVILDASALANISRNLHVVILPEAGTWFAIILWNANFMNFFELARSSLVLLSCWRFRTVLWFFWRSAGFLCHMNLQQCLLLRFLLMTCLERDQTPAVHRQTAAKMNQRSANEK